MERFAEAAGYYNPVAIPDTVTVVQGAEPFAIDVLANDYEFADLSLNKINSDNDIAYPNYPLIYAPGENPKPGRNLRNVTLNERNISIIEDSPITNITGDATANITVNPNVNGSSFYSIRSFNGTYNTAGEVIVDTTDTFVGTLTFDYEVCDSNPPVVDYGVPACDTATVTVQVEPNDAPTVSDVAVTATEDTPYTFVEADFAAGFSDPNSGETLTRIRIDSLPSNGTLILNGAEVVTGQEITLAELDASVGAQTGLEYRPNQEYCQTDTFTWNGQDSNPGNPLYATASANVNVTITCVDDAPQVADFAVATGFEEAFGFIRELYEANYSDVEDNPLNAVTITSLPNQGNLALRNPSVATQQRLFSSEEVALNQIIPAVNLDNLEYRPSAGFRGRDSFTYAATQSPGDLMSANAGLVSITVGRQVPRVQLQTPTLVITPEAETTVEAVITNPNDFALEDVTVRLTTDPARAPFVVGGYGLSKDGLVSQVERDSFEELALTFKRLEGGEEVILTTQVIPATTGALLINGATFVQGVDPEVESSELSLEVSEPETETISPAPVLIRTGGQD